MPQNYYSQIKTELINNEVYKRVKDYSKNRSDLATYYNVGKILIEAQGGEKRAKYGDELIKNYSKRLSEELGKGYSTRNLKNMRSFYLFIQKGHAMRAELAWVHYRELLPIGDFNKTEYYIDEIVKNCWSYRELHQHIKSRDYERLPTSTREKLAAGDKPTLPDIVKNPIIKNTRGDGIFSEKILQQLILEDLPHFLKELGEGFTFIDNEYKIRAKNSYNYIDLLLFNYKYDCFVVIELYRPARICEMCGQGGFRSSHESSMKRSRTSMPQE